MIINYKKFLFIIFVISVILIPLIRYEALNTTYYDLGLYGNNMYNFSANSFLSLGHLNLFFPLFSYFYNLLPSHYSVYFLLISQSLGFLYALKLVDKTYGRSLAISTAFSYPIWASLFFDFHFEFLSLIFALNFLFYNKKGDTNLAFLYAILIMFVKEVYALTTFACSIYMLISIKDFQFNIKDKKIFLPILLGFISIFYFLLSHYLINDKNLNINTSSQCFDGYNLFQYLCLLKHNLLPSLSLAIFQILSTTKILFFIIPLLFFLFVPLFGISGLLISFPTIFIALLSSNFLHSNVLSHYSVMLLPGFLEAFSIGIKKIGFQFSLISFIERILIYISIVLFSSFLLFGVLSNFSWKFHTSSYFISDRDIILKSNIERILNNPDFSVLTQNTINYSVIFNRKYVSVLGEKNKDNIHNYDFFIQDLKRPLFIDDISCHFRKGKCEDQEFIKRYNSIVLPYISRYTLVYSYDGFFIYKKPTFLQ